MWFIIHHKSSDGKQKKEGVKMEFSARVPSLWLCIRLNSKKDWWWALKLIASTIVIINTHEYRSNKAMQVLGITMLGEVNQM